MTRPAKEIEAAKPPTNGKRAGSGAKDTKARRPGAGINGSPEAKRKASVILEVLGGLRSPADAGIVLAVSLQRYYQLEIRALQGLVSALDVTPKRGPQSSPQVALRRLAAERDQLQRELRRAQALVRIAQRTIGVAPPESSRPKAKEAGKRRPKRPTVRARRVAEQLRFEVEAGARTEPPAAPVNGGASST